MIALTELHWPMEVVTAGVAQAGAPGRRRQARARAATFPRMKTSETAGYHEPVLLAETIEALQPAPGRVIIDGTLGGGGHAAALLAAGARVIGFDQDPEAIGFASQRLAPFADRFLAVQTSFGKAGAVLDSLRVESIDGALLDLGVSSRQLSEAGRGFSFLRDGPLDMRMDPDLPTTAADLVNSMASEQLEELFRTLGEEPAARRIAVRIVRQREIKPLATTLELAGIVERVVARRGKTHPATRVFQALRMAVNDETGVLQRGLEQLSGRLATGGRFAVITFHSIEDRIVKRHFAERSTEWVDRPEWVEPRRNPQLLFKRITRKAITARADEKRLNPRSRSAHLRVVEKL
jgi:16S rRNA (cytosine1402-N4)-methyltransferase